MCRNVHWELLGANSLVATENNVSVSIEQNVAQRLNSKHEFFPIGCIETTENKDKDFSCCNIEESLYLLNMMMDDSTSFQEGWIRKKLSGKTRNQTRSGISFSRVE